MSKATVDAGAMAMPDFAPGQWLNVGQPIRKSQLRGGTTLVHFWDYANLNCIRAIPYLRRWHQRYADKGLTIIGVHTPEFKFGRLRNQVETAVDRLRLGYPIMLDNKYETWSRFDNRTWPTTYLADEAGNVVFKREGSVNFLELELAIQFLLRRQDPGVEVPDPLPPLRREDKPGTALYSSTPELYAGFQGGGLFGGALGNPAGYYPQNPVFYELPASREEGQFYLEGVWRAWPEAVAYAGREGGKMVLSYSAATVDAVLAPSAIGVELALEMRPTEAEPIVLVKQDGVYVTAHNAGPDIFIAEDGSSQVRVSQARLYSLIVNPDHETHELELTLRATGLAIFKIVFTGAAIT